MEVITKSVHTAKALYLPYRETLVMPVGDVQYAGGGVNDPCDVSRFQRHLEWGVKRGAYFLGMGDLFDPLSPSNRRALKLAGLYDSAEEAYEEIMEQRLEKFQGLVKGTERHWLGLLQGDHYFEFEDGTTTDTRMCKFLKAPFLGDCAFVRLVFRAQGKPRAHCTIWCHHGAGGGKLISAPLNLLEHVIKAFSADIYLIGHQHKKVGAPINRIYVNWDRTPPTIEHRTVIIGCTGSFMRGYLQGHKRKGRSQGTYVEQRLLNPVALGGMVIYVRPRAVQGKYHLDLSVEL